MDRFIVKHYTSDEFPTIKGNGFDGLVVGEDREDADEFIGFVNDVISALIWATKLIGECYEPKVEDGQIYSEYITAVDKIWKR